MTTEEEEPQTLSLEEFEQAAADLIGAAQGALQEFEASMADVLQAQRQASAEARAEHGRAVAALEQIAKRGQEMAERQKVAMQWSERQFTNILERAAREGGGAMAETVGKGIADGIARRLDGTSRDAERAAARLEAAAEALTWKRFLAGAAGGLGVVLAAILAAWWILPNAADIRDLTAERDRLAAVVADLERRGGRADVTTCGNRGERGRLCVRVDPGAGRYGEGNDYMIIRGY